MLAGPAWPNYELLSGVATTTANITFAAQASSCVAAPSGIIAWWKADGGANEATGLYNATLGGDAK